MGTSSENWEDWLSSVQHDLDRGIEVRENPAWEFIAERVGHIAATLLHQKDIWTIDPDDLAQDVLLRLFSSSALRRIRASGSPEGYLIAVLRNRIRDELRRMRGKWIGEEPLSGWEDKLSIPEPGELSLEQQIM